MQLLTTSSGIEFGMLGAKPAAPAPTLFSFAMSIEVSLGDRNYCETARLLSEQGFVCVSLDLPCHGKDERKEDGGAALAGWPNRVANGNSLVRDFTQKVSDVLDHLVAEKYSDPAKVAAFGISRGGFMACQCAAADSRIRCIAGLCPVTDLQALTEFANMKTDAVRALALASAADKLAGRSLWVNIGNDDQRVSTDSAIDFARRVACASIAQEKRNDVELHVYATPGHAQPQDSQRKAAEWIAKRIGPG